MARIAIQDGHHFKFTIPAQEITHGNGGKAVKVERNTGAGLVTILAAGAGGGGGVNMQWGNCYPPGGDVGHGGAGGASGQDGSDATYLYRPLPCDVNQPPLVKILGGGRGGTLIGGAGGIGLPPPAPNTDGSSGGPWVGGLRGQGGKGGDGGVGYFGGGGGASSFACTLGCAASHTGAAGGGGSSFVLDQPGISAVIYPGHRRMPGLSTDPDRGGHGEGGTFTSLPGFEEGRGHSGRVLVAMKAGSYGDPLPPPVAPPRLVELTHGYRAVDTLSPAASAEAVYQIRQQAFESYEVVVDGTSGDIGNPPSNPLKLELVDLLGNVSQSATGAGSGPGRSLRWRNTSSSAVSEQLIRVASNTCTTNCGPEDQYRIRAYETTYSIARFNNSGTQATVLAIENPTNANVDVTIYFWNAAGTLLHTLVPATLAPKSVYVYSTATVVPNLSGSMTISNTAPYGRLSGKAISVETSTGFSFDTLMEPRRR